MHMATSLPVALTLFRAAEARGAAVAIPIQVEMIAVIIASLAGLFAARERKLDLIGAVGLGVVCGLGGGLLRDMILQVGDVYILRQPLALPISMASAAIAFTFPRIVGRPDGRIAVLDILSVGIYAATGADKALVYGFDPLVAVMMGFFTAVGGGMLRDICLGSTPAIFQRSNFYALAAIGGSATYATLVKLTSVSHVAALVACVAVTVALRFLSIRFDIKSPGEEDLARVTRPIRQAGHRAGRHAVRMRQNLAQKGRGRIQRGPGRRR